MPDPTNLRDYGYGDSPEVAGQPKVLGFISEPCPNCACIPTFQIEVVMAEPPSQLRVPPGSHAVGTYVGCAACPWASPMMTTARPKGN